MGAQIMIGSRLSRLVGSHVLADGRSLFGRRPEEIPDGSGVDWDRMPTLVMHGPSMHADAQRTRQTLGRAIVVLLATDILLLGYDYWTRPRAPLHTAAFALATLAALVGAWATWKRYLLLLLAVQCTYAIQFFVGLMMVTARVQLARLTLLVLLYFLIESFRLQSDYTWFIPFQ